MVGHVPQSVVDKSAVVVTPSATSPLVPVETTPTAVSMANHPIEVSPEAKAAAEDKLKHVFVV